MSLAIYINIEAVSRLLGVTISNVTVESFTPILSLFLTLFYTVSVPLLYSGSEIFRGWYAVVVYLVVNNYNSTYYSYLTGTFHNNSPHSLMSGNKPAQHKEKTMV